MLDSTVHAMCETLDCLKRDIMFEKRIFERAKLCDYYHRVVEMLPDDAESSRSAYFGTPFRDSSTPISTLKEKVIEHRITVLLELAGHVANRIKNETDVSKSQEDVKYLKELVSKIPDIKYTGVYFDGQPIQKKINILRAGASMMITL